MIELPPHRALHPERGLPKSLGGIPEIADPHRAKQRLQHTGACPQNANSGLHLPNYLICTGRFPWERYRAIRHSYPDNTVPNVCGVHMRFATYVPTEGDNSYRMTFDCSCGFKFQVSENVVKALARNDTGIKSHAMTR